MKRTVLVVNTFVLAILSASPAAAQPLAPGGVPGARIWNIPVASGTAYQWTNIADTGGFSANDRLPSSVRSLNYNPAFYFEGDKHETVSPIDLSKYARLTMMAVYQSADSLQEQSVWTVESKDSASLVMTTARMADLQEYAYLTIGGQDAAKAGLFSYIRNRPDNASDSSAGAQWLRIGRKPQSQSLPLNSFKGVIAEVIVFDRVLSTKERRQVESYLSLKYGLSLDQTVMPASYLNARGETIWDAGKNTGYTGRITGIGRDDLSGLRQFQSASSLAPGLLQMSLNKEEALTDNSFLIWSDNNGALRMNKEQGVPKQLRRKWRVSAYGAFAGHTTRLQIDRLQMEDRLEKGDPYWLMIDRSGSGRFPVGQTEFVRAAEEGVSENKIVFPEIRWDMESKSIRDFTLIQAPPLFAYLNITSPACRTSYAGRIDGQVEGGMLPYEIILADHRGNVLQQFVTEEPVFRLQGIEQGHYFLKVIDAGRQYYSEELYISHSDGPALHLEQVYDLPEKQSLTIDASKGLEAGFYTFLWDGPGRLHSEAASLAVKQAGSYAVTVTNEQGCSSTAVMEVRATKQSNFKEIVLYPNPSSDGAFKLRIHLYRPAPVSIRIYDLQGKPAYRAEIKEKNEVHIYEGTVSGRGTYMIMLESEGRNEVRQWLVQP